VLVLGLPSAIRPLLEVAPVRVGVPEIPAAEIVEGGVRLPTLPRQGTVTVVEAPVSVQPVPVQPVMVKPVLVKPVVPVYPPKQARN
jgi:hypothetical protein